MYIKTIYIIRTVDNRKYSYESKYDLLNNAYKEIMDKEHVKAEDWKEDNVVIINTRHIVSIERWL
ncbi:hypothetical protein BE25_0202 [Staphylococcus phage vB_SepM_BE25]|nr:hypothetical protein Twillingate_186 [Staphylococcus phage Twillingate]WEU70688.1 hypothetical protein BE25_0202 [Staphylococcus phage vB_SepM_BE25]